MSKTISEQALETAIVADLTRGHYIQRQPSAFDKAPPLEDQSLYNMVYATDARWHNTDIQRFLRGKDLSPRRKPRGADERTLNVPDVPNGLAGRQCPHP